MFWPLSNTCKYQLYTFQSRALCKDWQYLSNIHLLLKLYLSATVLCSLATVRTVRSLEIKELGTCSNSEVSSLYDVASFTRVPFAYLLKPLTHRHFCSPLSPVSLFWRKYKVSMRPDRKPGFLSVSFLRARVARCRCCLPVSRRVVAVSLTVFLVVSTGLGK